MHKKDIQRFLEKVEKTNDCWYWKAGKSRGYGQFRLNRKQQPAHRVSWQIHNGKIPNKLCICHTCDVRHCVNPKHLFLGTYQDNSTDMVKKNRHSKGEKHTSAKLTQKQVIKIKKLYISNKFTHITLAEKFNIHRSTVGAILENRNWKHI